MSLHVAYDNFFCTMCGDSRQHKNKQCHHCGAVYNGKAKYGGQVAQGAAGVGWSNQIYHPRFAKHDGHASNYNFIY